MLRNLCSHLNNGLRRFIVILKNNKFVSSSIANLLKFKVALRFSSATKANTQLTNKTTPISQVEIDNKTVIGRRLLSDHFEVVDKKTTVLLKAFIDTRIDKDLSFDALGYSGNSDKSIINILRKIVKKQYELTSENYVAWAGINKRTIPHLKVLSTPDTNQQNPNPHHCDLDRSNHRNKLAARSLAYELLTLANQESLFIPVDPKVEVQSIK